jgi:hypothetical protein
VEAVQLSTAAMVDIQCLMNKECLSFCRCTPEQSEFREHLIKQRQQSQWGSNLVAA